MFEGKFGDDSIDLIETSSAQDGTTHITAYYAE